MCDAHMNTHTGGGDNRKGVRGRAAAEDMALTFGGRSALVSTQRSFSWL